jgi:UDP-N-acetyl-D-mannosaminuronate dehydrogenase
MLVAQSDRSFFAPYQGGDRQVSAPMVTVLATVQATIQTSAATVVNVGFRKTQPDLRETKTSSFTRRLKSSVECNVAIEDLKAVICSLSSTHYL